MMLISIVFFSMVVGVTIADSTNLWANQSLVVDDTPSTVRPYILPYLTGSVWVTGNVAYRFPITRLSSGGAFTLLTTNTNQSATVSVPPHKHIARYENFFCSRGELRMWLGKNNSTDQSGRDLRPGDMAASPPSTTHTFQTMQPDTELFGVTYPAGLEDLFYATMSKTFYPSSTPYEPVPGIMLPSTPPPPFDPTAFAGFDIYPQPDFIPRQDFSDGTAPANSGWHITDNALPNDGTTPFFLATDFAPKYLNKQDGYQIIHTLSTATQSAAHNFTLSYITMTRLQANVTPTKHQFLGATGLRIDRGAMMLEIDGYPEEQMLQGDVAFIPGNTTFSYYSKIPYTKVLHMASGVNGLDSTLLKTSTPWDYPTWPTS